jgi:hypothetical protein
MGERARPSCRAKAVFRLQPDPVTGDGFYQDYVRREPPRSKKVGAVIYLSTNRPLHLPDFLLNSTKAGRICYSRRRARSHPRPVPCRQARLRTRTSSHARPARGYSARPSTPHCTGRRRTPVLAGHQAHLSVAESAENSGVLGLACDLTKAIAALLPVTDSPAVC